MAGKALHVNKIEEIKRLADLGFSQRKISRALKVHRDTVKRHLTDEGKAKPEVESDTWLDKLDWQAISGELRQGVPIKILWEEQATGRGIDVSYEGFWKQLRKRFPKTKESMHRPFVPGERCEIDYCDGISIYDPHTGTVRKTQLFVGVLCFSRYTFAEFTWTQNSQDFLSSHRRMFEFFGGVPRVISPDNLKSAVTKAHKYDPVINEAYTRLAAHYQVGVVPARVRKPKDKAIAERTIQIFQRWFFFAVRNRRFTSLAELNQCLAEHIKNFHKRKHRIFQRTREEMFEGEKKHLLRLPEQPYEVQIHRQAKLHPDCHLCFDRNYYSAPWQHRGKQLDVWASTKTVEIYADGERVAIHARGKNPGTFITDKKHYPPRHEAYWDGTLKSLRNKAEKIGGNVSKVILELLDTPNPLEHTRRCQGIIRLHDRYPANELDEACRLALQYHKLTYRFVEGVLKGGYLQRSKSISEAPKRGENPYLRRDKLIQEEESQC